MKYQKFPFIGLVFFLFAISGCSSGYLGQSIVNEAIRLGKEYKFKAGEIPYIVVEGREVCGGSKYYCDEVGEIKIYTPYKTIMFMAAIKAEEYKELTSAELEYWNADKVQFIVEADKAIIKYNIKYNPDNTLSFDVLQPISVVTEDSLTAFYFPYSKIKDQKIKLTIITPHGEKSADIDMSKYK